MMGAGPKAIAVSKALESVLRKERGRLMAALAYRLGSLQLAEDALQEACISAMVHWSRSGLPLSPEGWLVRVASRKALDQLRREGRSADREIALAQLTDWLVEDTPQGIPDERLRLIFTSCHPELELKSRVALTLRVVCGLPTGAIARLFLDHEATMAQRLSRAKAKIAQNAMAFQVPEPDQWDERLQAVLVTIYLIFTSAYTQSEGDAKELTKEALFLIGLLNRLVPGHAEIEGAMALMLFTQARSDARVDLLGVTVPPSEQNRQLWDRESAAAAQELLERALLRKRIGPFQLKAAISACQMAEPEPDWVQILQLYTLLLTFEPTPVVRLNHAVALSETGHLTSAREVLEELREGLSHFQPYYAALASVLAKSRDSLGAAQAYSQAIALADKPSDRLYLEKQRARLA